MGTGITGCCKLESLPQPKASIAAAQVTGVFPGFQTFKDYALRYEEIQLVSTTSSTSRGRVSDIRALDSGLLYVSRRAPYIEAPLRESVELVHRHLETLCELEHPHLCKLVECFSDPESGDYLLVSERAEAPNLLDYIDEHGLPNGDVDASDCVRQILSGLAYAHQRGIVHGRLRHDVLLLAGSDGAHPSSRQSTRKSTKNPEKEEKREGPPQIKVCDMGLGYVLREPLGSSNAKYEGLLYVPPENAWAEAEAAGHGAHPPERPEATELAIAEDGAAPLSEEVTELERSQTQRNSVLMVALEPPMGITGHWSETLGGVAPAGADKVDVWAVGVLTFHLLSGLLPFEASDEEKLMTHLRIHKPKFTKDPWGDIPSKAYNAVDMMLKLTPAMRPSASDMLRHPWLRMARHKASKSRVFNLYKNAICNLYEGQFKKLVIRIITKQLSGHHTHKEEALDVFRMLDKDRDGLISFEEFEASMKRVPNLSQYLVDPAMLFEAIDRNGSGALDAHEFMAATLPPSEARDPKNLWNAFRAFDKNESGSITLDEVETAVRLLEGSLISAEQNQELCAAIRVELETLGFGKNLLVSMGLHDHDDDSQFAKSMEKCLSITPGHRRLDFGEFLYLCSIRNHHCKLPSWSKKEVYRCVDICCDVDMYHQSHRQKDMPWPPLEGASARSPESIYEKHGLHSNQDKRRESRKRSSQRYVPRSSVRAAHGAHSNAAAAQKSAQYNRFHPTHHGHHWHAGHHVHGEHHEHKPHEPGEHHHHHHHHHHGGGGGGGQSARGGGGHQSARGGASPRGGQAAGSSSASPAKLMAPKKKPKRPPADRDSEAGSDED